MKLRLGLDRFVYQRVLKRPHLKYISKDVCLSVAIPGILWICSNVNASENIKGIRKMTFAMTHRERKNAMDQHDYSKDRRASFMGPVLFL